MLICSLVGPSKYSASERLCYCSWAAAVATAVFVLVEAFVVMA